MADVKYLIKSVGEDKKEDAPIHSVGIFFIYHYIT
ncbi:hypothetical protein G3A_01885 [Bacillus sp. 17376]|nr:hypothetical protein G3A_01885 [Bacillus sp. 17376]